MVLWQKAPAAGVEFQKQCRTHKHTHAFPSHAIKKFLRTLYLGGARVISAHFNQNEGSNIREQVEYWSLTAAAAATEPAPHLSTCTNYSGGFICSHRCAVATRSFVCANICIALCERVCERAWFTPCSNFTKRSIRHCAKRFPQKLKWNASNGIVHAVLVINKWCHTRGKKRAHFLQVNLISTSQYACVRSPTETCWLQRRLNAWNWWWERASE